METRNRSFLRRSLAILGVSVACLIVAAFFLVPVIPPRARTASAMSETAVRIDLYVARGDHRLPADLSVLPTRDGHANRTSDAWKRPLGYQPGPHHTFVLTSLGRDGLPGGTGDDADVVRRYRVIRGRVEEIP